MASKFISLSCCGVRDLTVACVPTGMNAGVWIVPCGVVIMPVRAGQCVSSWMILNEKEGDVFFFFSGGFVVAILKI